MGIQRLPVLRSKKQASNPNNAALNKPIHSSPALPR